MCVWAWAYTVADAAICCISKIWHSILVTRFGIMNFRLSYDCTLIYANNTNGIRTKNKEKTTTTTFATVCFTYAAMSVENTVSLHPSNALPCHANIAWNNMHKIFHFSQVKSKWSMADAMHYVILMSSIYLHLSTFLVFVQIQQTHYHDGYFLYSIQYTLLLRILWNRIEKLYGISTFQK